MKRGARPTAAAEHELRFEGARTESWAAALEAFASVLGQPPWAGTHTRVVIADHWARYAEAVAGWELCISDAPPRASRVICAVPGELIEGVRAACAAQGGTLLSLQPQLVAAYEAWRPCLPQTNAWFVSVEQGSLAAARLGRYGWERVHGVRIGSDWMRELKRLQTFGRLAKIGRASCRER